MVLSNKNKRFSNEQHSIPGIGGYGRPKFSAFAREGLSVFDIASAPARLLVEKKRKATQKHPPVIVIPGIGADDYSTLALRLFLKKKGYHAEGWGLGLNVPKPVSKDRIADLSKRWDFNIEDAQNGEADVPALIEKVAERIEKRSRELKGPVVLIGWSFGGYIAREVTREIPHAVSAVITMGSPVIGGPRYSVVAPIFGRRGFDFDLVEKSIAERFNKPIKRPVTVIYSKNDGVVNWQASIDHWSPDVVHHEVNARHIGLGFNSEVWSILDNTLSKL